MIRIPGRRCFRQVSPMVLASLLSVLAALPAKAQTASSADTSVSQQLEKLAATLRATQQQVEQSQKQIQQMQAEIDRLRSLLAAKDALPTSGATAAPPTGSAAVTESSERSSDTSEDIDILKLRARLNSRCV
jgi:uncharacterized protein YlxW (UPF0749 family)